MKFSQIGSILALATLLCACAPATPTADTLDTGLAADETAALQTILAAYDAKLCPSLASAELARCYQAYFAADKVMQNDKIWANLDARAYMEALPPDVFAQVWVREPGFSKPQHDSAYVARDFVHFNPQGAYLQFLDHYRQIPAGAWLGGYVEKYRAIGDISPSMITDLLTNEEIDYTDPRNRLVVVIHHLTLDVNLH